MEPITERQCLHNIELPQSVIENFARFLVPELRKFYDSEQGQAFFCRVAKRAKREEYRMIKERSRLKTLNALSC